MRIFLRTIAIAALLLILFLIGRCSWRHFAGANEEKKEGPTALVEVAALTRKTIAEKLTAYGSVIAQPGKTHSFTVGFETRVRHVLVAPGQLVHEGNPTGRKDSYRRDLYNTLAQWRSGGYPQPHCPTQSGRYA